MKDIGHALLFFVLVLTAPGASACDCDWPSIPKAFEDSTAVFVGKFIGFTDQGALKLRVEKNWKGSLPREVVLPYLDLVDLCGDVKFILGEKYLIYASPREGGVIPHHRLREKQEGE
jgi:hypothetical protein